MAKKKTDKPKRGKGRPKRVFTAAQLKKIDEYALEGCHVNTIAVLLGIPSQTMMDRMGDRIKIQHCKRKLKLREQQNKTAADGNPALLIFLGKNYLDQADKIEEKIQVTGMDQLLTDLDGNSKGLPELPKKS